MRIWKRIHIIKNKKVVATNDMKYLKKFFDIMPTGNGLTSLKSKHQDLNFAYVNTYGEYNDVICGELIIGWSYDEEEALFPFTIVMNCGIEYYQRITKQKDDLKSDIHKLEIKLGDIAEKLNEFWPSYTTGEK